ncbi:hypothetical protein C7R88_07375 [Plesiomonas shigelloides]|uniref:DUF2897 family protein n=1 Tax=Plesiomonas shigelloides TaxID=703 RepID=UPI000D13900A|nr:DUF2897 family protein [Plesiomonas shigelloides]AVQ87134.1 hypothetical protein C7R88_07375 [Plesiomonas shigelloides]
MDLLDKGWFIIFLVIAFIGGNLAALRVTANMKFPRGRAPASQDADAPVEPHPDDSANASDGNTPDTSPDTPPDASKVAPSAPPSPKAENVPQPTPSTEQNVTAAQREKAVRKQDHNHNNDLV